MEEHVVFVNAKNEPIGTCPKQQVHGEQTPLHRGFSIFVFDHDGRLLLQQRSADKKTWPLIWSNSCCGHPQMDETTATAIRRRLKYELRIEECDVYEVVADYRYVASRDGVMENEFCPVWVGWTSSEPKLNVTEVVAIQWVDWRCFIQAILDVSDHTYDELSCWSLEEARLLNESARFQELWKERVT